MLLVRWLPVSSVRLGSLEFYRYCDFFFLTILVVFMVTLQSKERISNFRSVLNYVGVCHSYPVLEHQQSSPLENTYLAELNCKLKLVSVDISSVA